MHFGTGRLDFKHVGERQSAVNVAYRTGLSSESPSRKHFPYFFLTLSLGPHSLILSRRLVHTERHVPELTRCLL